MQNNIFSITTLRNFKTFAFQFSCVAVWNDANKPRIKKFARDAVNLGHACWLDMMGISAYTSGL